MRGIVSKNIAVFSLVFRPLSCGHLALSLWACAERKYSVKHILIYWRLWTGKATYPQAVRKEKEEGTGDKIYSKHFNKVPRFINLPTRTSPCKLMVIAGLNHWPAKRSPDLIFSTNVPTDYSEACVPKLLGCSQSNELNKQDHHHLEEQSFADTKIKQAA